MIAICLSLLLGAGMPSLIEFELADQFDRVRSDTDFRGEILLVVGSDKRGSRYQGPWIEALRTEDVAIVEVADLRGVPFFVKGMVKKKFPSDKNQWVLMDWKGQFAQSYEFERDACTILIFDRAGTVLHQVAVRELDEKRLALARAEIRAAVRSAEP